MKISKILTLSVITTAVLFGANPLIKKAKDSGMVAIPTDKNALMKLIDNPKNRVTDKKVELGKALFFEPRLSKSNLISCNTCHNLATGGVDGLSSAIGHKWTQNPHHLNSPTVYNAVFMDKQFWDGRAADLEEQAQGPLQAKPEMAISKEMAVARISSMNEYKEQFKAVWGDNNITFKRIADAIGAFERTLVTPSRFDAFLNGDEKSLNSAEQEGLKVFIDKGCVSCHTGIGIGGSMNPFPVVNRYKYADIGDFTGDKNKMVKTPTLRNIMQTAPYFHNGAVWDIKEAIKIMGDTQLGIKLTDKEVTSIATFLKSLDGEIPTITYPKLPRVTADTPKPDTK
ncbi:MAG TPA: cytochrome-c peroxidase [Campylobacterales bacterium]|nr:cytochrome-c peroxidase [Campylobacterales bacterium]HHD80370.1 cytochrome-c peroxidase [Campylobacterales bacterium]HHH51848.1 cytochrome-c peroxidase [Campylobacterales bacterium]